MRTDTTRRWVSSGLALVIAAWLAPAAAATDGRVVYMDTGTSTTTPQNRSYTGGTDAFSAAAATVAGAATITWTVDRQAPTRDEHIAGVVTSGGQLYVMRWNGAAWSAEWNVAVGGNGVDGRRFDIAYERTTGNAVVVYSTNATGSSGNAEMAYRVWNGASWTAAANVVANSAGFNQAAAVTWIKLSSRPTSGSNEIALLAADTGSTTANTSILTSFIWNGAAWTEAATTHTASAGATLPNTTTQLMQNECFDQAYETLSGDLLVIFTTVGGTQQQWYRTYSGGVWGAAGNFGTGRTAPIVMVAAADPASNQIICAFNRGGSQNVYAAVWSGTALGGITNIGTSGQNPAVEERPLAAGWLTSAGTTAGVVFFGETNANVVNYAYTTNSGGAWTGATFAITLGNRAFMEADVDPALTDRLVFLVSDTNSDLFSRQVVWSGAAFTINTPTNATLTTTLASSTTQNFMFAFNRPPTTTVGDGTNPGNASLCPGGAATMLDAFTLSTNTGTDTVTAVTVTLAAGTSAGVGLVEITNDAGTTVYGSVANPGSDIVAIPLGTSIPVTTTATQYKVRITPKSAIAMPAPPGASYAVTGTVTSVTDGNTDVYSDTTSGTVTIDNLSPGVPTGVGTIIHGYGIEIYWTNPVDADFSQVVILRNTVPVTDVPVEGSTYVAGSLIGTSTVVYAGGGTATTDTGPFTPGANYYYALFANDTCRNYSTGVALGPLLAKAAVADISISKNASVASTTVGGTYNYILIVSNGGPDGAAGPVTVTDALPAGVGANGAITTTQGTCTGTTNISCNLGALANGASVTITIPVINNSPGTKSNTATVSNAGPGDYDPNTTNNSSTVTTPVTGTSSILCATPGKDGPGGVLNTVVNTYYPPGTGTVFAGQANTCIPVGAPDPLGASTAVTAGDLLLVIQMQDADVDSSNTNAYGAGPPSTSGAGAIAVNAGRYEYVVANGPVTGGCIPITGTGANGGLVNGYQNGDATATKGAMRYQVIRVPQYTTATLGGVTAAPWNTRTTATDQYGTGGVLVMDVQGTLTVNAGVAATVDGLGFRGGSGRQLYGDPGPTVLNAWTNVSSTAPGNTNGTVTTGTFTPAAAPNAGQMRILLVAAAARLSGASTLTAFSATYGAVAMHPVGTTASANSQVHAGLWYLLESEIPAGANAVALTYNTGSGATVTGLHIKWGNYWGVDNVFPVYASAVNTNAGNPVQFGTAVPYLQTNANIFIAVNGATTATLAGPTGGDIATVAGATNATNTLASFIGQTNPFQEAAGGSYAAGTTVTFGGTPAAMSAVVVASLGNGPVTNVDWRSSSGRSTNGSKGEGVGGTPEWIQVATGPTPGPFKTNQPFDGYPNGSYARGAPANAGGGSTDANPPANDQNSGGGGGSNGGAGGTGGYSWNSCLDRGGRGAAVTPAITKLVLGGGGGAGTRNNNPGLQLASGGANGGGLMVIRAAQISAAAGAILSANGDNAYNGTLNDGGGGGGAGGSVIITGTTGGMANLTIRANGGTGGNAWQNQGLGGANCTIAGVTYDINNHGPGGGGGGGVIVYSNSAQPPTLSVTGGAPGITADGTNFLAGPGGTGQILVVGPGYIPGGGSGAECTPDPAVTLTHTPTTLTPGGTGTVTAAVNNVAPFLATNGTITVTITLAGGASGLTPTSASGTGWSCGIAGQVVTCTRSDSLPAQAAYPPINIAVTVGSAGTGSGTLTNTATIANSACAPCEANLTNDTASDPYAIAAPTLARMRKLKAERVGDAVLLTWTTGYEADNLGWVIYRENQGKRTPVNPGLIAGSAFFAGKLPLTSGKSYAWLDKSPEAKGASVYWLLDLDLRGKQTFTGPATVVVPGKSSRAELVANSPLLSELGRGGEPAATAPGLGVAARQAARLSRVQPLATVWSGAGRSAAKILVTQEGWYRVAKSALIGAGFDPGTDPARLQLFAEGVEQAIRVNDGGDGTFDAGDTLEFYGTGLDAPYTGTRVYWLLAGPGTGLRIPAPVSPGTQPPGPTSFPYTVELREHTVFVSALLTPNGVANFFGAPITSVPTPQQLTVTHLDTAAAGPASVTVALQGFSTDAPHAVDVLLNGSPLGTMGFPGQSLYEQTFSVPVAALVEGTNTVTLTALGATDVSIVSSVRITYPHLFTPDSGALKMTATTPSHVALAGAAASTRVVDVTNPAAVTELLVTSSGGGASFDVTGASPRTLLAFDATRVLAPAGIVANAPSDLAAVTNGADLVVLSHPTLMGAVAPLASLRQAQGWSVKSVDVTDVYDEFGFGEKSPEAIRDFLSWAKQKWQVKPRYLLVAGDASFDPRNYLGMGDFDLVPTRLVPMTYNVTDSDDWLVDFNADGTPDMAVGRLPVRDATEAAAVVGKILSHDQAGSVGPWNQNVLLVSDNKGDFDFAAASSALAPLFTGGVTVTHLQADVLGSGIHDQVVSNVNSGQLLVNYVGHGSEGVWSQSGFFDGTDAAALTNGTKLPVFVLMTCLNGLFDDLFQQCLAEDLIKAPGGGAVAVWASSALTEPSAQAAMDQAFVTALQGPTVTLGDAALQAKAAASDPDVKRSWILFGDPTMRLHPTVVPVELLRFDAE